MHVLYAMHTIAWPSMGMLAVIALIINYIKRADENDSVYVSHHNYMIATFWWTVLWLVVTSPLYLLLFLPGIDCPHHRPAVVPVPLHSRLAALHRRPATLTYSSITP